MLNIKLGKIIDYAVKNEKIMEVAVPEFFDSGKSNYSIENEGQVCQLFNEWLIFNFKLPSGLTVINEYYFKNPDNLTPELLLELKQIIETQLYDYFEIEKVKAGQWMDILSLFTGKKYRVYEVMFSIEMEGKKGSFYNRIAKINDKYYFIGGNPLVFSITFTDRSRRFYQTTKNDVLITPKNLLKLIEEKNQKVDPRLSITKHDIKIKRNELAKKFENFVNQYGLVIKFERLTDFLYHESYKSNYADFYTDIIKIGIPEKMIINNSQFFQDLWNYFPHKKLSDKCPAEKFKEVYG